MRSDLILLSSLCLAVVALRPRVLDRCNTASFVLDVLTPPVGGASSECFNPTRNLYESAGNQWAIGLRFPLQHAWSPEIIANLPGIGSETHLTLQSTAKSLSRSQIYDLYALSFDYLDEEAAARVDDWNAVCDEKKSGVLALMYSLVIDDINGAQKVAASGPGALEGLPDVQSALAAATVAVAAAAPPAAVQAAWQDLAHAISQTEWCNEIQCRCQAVLSCIAADVDLNTLSGASYDYSGTGMTCESCQNCNWSSATEGAAGCIDLPSEPMICNPVSTCDVGCLTPTIEPTAAPSSSPTPSPTPFETHATDCNCSRLLLINRICDVACNHSACFFDGGACSGGGVTAAGGVGVKMDTSAGTVETSSGGTDVAIALFVIFMLGAVLLGAVFLLFIRRRREALERSPQVAAQQSASGMRRTSSRHQALTAQRASRSRSSRRPSRHNLGYVADGGGGGCGGGGSSNDGKESLSSPLYSQPIVPRQNLPAAQVAPTYAPVVSAGPRYDADFLKRGGRELAGAGRKQHEVVVSSKERQGDQSTIRGRDGAKVDIDTELRRDDATPSSPNVLYDTVRERKADPNVDADGYGKPPGGIGVSPATANDSGYGKSPGRVGVYTDALSKNAAARVAYEELELAPASEMPDEVLAHSHWRSYSKNEAHAALLMPAATSPPPPRVYVLRPSRSFPHAFALTYYNARGKPCDLLVTFERKDDVSGWTYSYLGLGGAQKSVNSVEEMLLDIRIK